MTPINYPNSRPPIALKSFLFLVFPLKFSINVLKEGSKMTFTQFIGWYLRSHSMANFHWRECVIQGKFFEMFWIIARNIISLHYLYWASWCFLGLHKISNRRFQWILSVCVILWFCQGRSVGFVVIFISIFDHSVVNFLSRKRLG